MPGAASAPSPTPASPFQEAFDAVAVADQARPPHQKIDAAPEDTMEAGGTTTRPCGHEGVDNEQGPSCRGLVKSLRQIRWQLRLEWALLRKVGWKWVLGVLLVEYVHLVSRNAVYYIQGKVYRDNKADGMTANDKEFPLEPLKDLGFMLLGEGRWLPISLEWLETLFIALSGGFMVLLWLSRIFLNVRAGGPKVAIAGRDAPARPVLVIPMPVVLILRQMAMVAALVIPLRCITFLTTLLPPPAAHCQRAWTPPQELSKVFNPFESPRTGCGDQMFSGHVLHGVLVALMALRYFPHHPLISTLAFLAVAALGVFLVIFRAHYTADVLVSLYVTWGGWLLLEKYEPRDLNRYGIRANVLVRPNYMSTGTDPWRTRDVMAQFEEAEAAEEQEAAAAGAGGDAMDGGGGPGVAPAAMEEGKVEAAETEAAGAGSVGLCRRCRARLPGGGDGGGDGGRRRRKKKKRPTTTYLPPLPPSCPPLVEHSDLTESARAFERLPW